MGAAADTSIKAAGAAMAAAALGIVVAMAHHPTHVDSRSIGGVHAALILFLLLVAWGFASFVLWRGIRAPLLLLGLLAYGVSLFGHIGAATVNGFAVPALAAHGEPIGRDTLRLAWELNQALAGLGVFMTALAYLLWSAHLLRDHAPSARITAVLGLAAGAAAPLLLVTGVTRMDVTGATLVYGLQVAWAALVGIQLMRGRIGPGDHANE